MKIKNSITISIDHLSCGGQPSSFDEKEGELAVSSSPSTFDMKGFNLVCNIDEELSEQEFEANMKLASSVISGIMTGVPAMLTTFQELDAKNKTLVHQQRLEEMREADRIEREKHERIQASKTVPALDEKIVQAMSAVNADLVEQLKKAVRGY